MRAIAYVLSMFLLVGCATADQQPESLPPIHVGQSLAEIRAIYPDAKTKGFLILGDPSGPEVTVGWPMRDGTIGAFISRMRKGSGSQQSRLDALVARFCQGQEIHPGPHPYETVCGKRCPLEQCVFLVDIDCFVPGKEEDGGLAEDKSTYADEVCTWVEATKDGDEVRMANGYRMFNQPGDRGSRSR